MRPTLVALLPLVVPLPLAACAQPADLSFSPASLALGEVDFAGEQPEEGYASETVTLTNASGPSLTLSLPAYDFDHLCLAGFPDDQTYPLALGVVDEGGAYTFVVGVCAYVPGELTREVTTEVVVATDGDPAEVVLPVTFTAIRTAE